MPRRRRSAGAPLLPSTRRPCRSISAGGAATLSNLGQILRRQGRVDEAEEAYKQALLTVDVGGDACRSIAGHVLNDYAAFLRERGRGRGETHAARRRAAQRGAVPAASKTTSG